MPRLSAIPSLIAIALVFAITVWWLASVALQLKSEFADVAELSTRAAAAMILVQWILIALFSAPAVVTLDVREPSALANLSAVTLPLWPLLVLLWLTSKLSLIVLIVSQLGAVSLAVGMVLLSRAVASGISDAQLRQLLAMTASVAVAAMIWMARTQLLGWLSR